MARAAKLIKGHGLINYCFNCNIQNALPAIAEIHGVKCDIE